MENSRSETNQERRQQVIDSFYGVTDILTYKELSKSRHYKLARWLERFSYSHDNKMLILKSDDLSVTVCLYTNDNVYSIRADEDLQHLSCISDSRRKIPGESWTRGHDIRGGSYTEETFNKIIKSIVYYELQTVVTY